MDENQDGVRSSSGPNVHLILEARLSRHIVSRGVNNISRKFHNIQRMPLLNHQLAVWVRKDPRSHANHYFAYKHPNFKWTHRVFNNVQHCVIEDSLVQKLF